MRLLGNLVWFIFGGFFAAIVWFLAGLILCITIIGIPLGLQMFKFSSLMLWPMGKEVSINFDKHPILNILWLIFFGWETAIGYLILTAFFFITIIGIPWGLQWFKLTRLALLPFGATVQ